MLVLITERTTLTVEKGSIVEIDASLLPLLKGRCEVVDEKEFEQEAPVKKTRKKKADA